MTEGTTNYRSAPTQKVAPIRRISQIRQYAPDPVPDDIVDHLLELARWTGSSKNTQPWRFIVVRDKTRLKQLSALRPNINWLATAPLGIAIALEGTDALSLAYDEGRLTERILTGASLLGYGGGVAWYGDQSQQAEAKRILSIPDELTARQIVMIGRALSTRDPRPSGPPRGRKRLEELVSYEQWGSRRKV